MGKIVLPLVFFFSLPIILFSTILLFSFFFLDFKQQDSSKKTVHQPPPTKTLAALTSPNVSQNEMDTLVNRYLSDPRIEGVRNFFAYYKSPLEPYAEDVVILADVYTIDYRLVPAIAMQESTLCKKAPKGTHNCWGFGIYGSKKTAFDNYLHGIHTVTKGLALRYIQQGLTTPEEIMKKYTPANKGEWARNVGDFMARIEQMTPQNYSASSLAERDLTRPEKELEVNRRSLGLSTLFAN